MGAAETARPAAPPTGRPVLLDAFSGAGGAAVGYHRAGFDVVGVDIAPQPRYPFAFEQGDAIEFIRRHGREFDAIHASPPCQAYSDLRAVHPGREHPRLVEPTRAALLSASRPYAIENVEGAPLVEPILLCGTMFPELRVYRHRLFECSWFSLAPPHAPHRSGEKTGNGKINRNGYVGVYGGGGNTAYKRLAMGIDWMTRDELAQAIPPAYTTWLGARLLRALGAAA
jgi:DNA (cytosine-5)-methyltransferase 1